MYGLVNQGIHAFIVEHFGHEDWEDICRETGLEFQEFESMLTYPDDVTYRLIDCISKKYKMSAAEVLKTFGDYWVDFSSSSKLGQLMRFGGTSLVERLETLNEMHARIKTTMPHLKPPEFEFEVGENGTHKLHYASDREGLEPMVIGLVEGLGRETGESLKITQDPKPAYAEYRASFTITLAQ